MSYSSGSTGSRGRGLFVRVRVVLHHYLRHLLSNEHHVVVVAFVVLGGGRAEGLDDLDDGVVGRLHLHYVDACLLARWLFFPERCLGNNVQLESQILENNGCYSLQAYLNSGSRIVSRFIPAGT